MEVNACQEARSCMACTAVASRKHASWYLPEQSVGLPYQPDLLGCLLAGYPVVAWHKE